MKPPIFIDEKIQKCFDEDGFVVIDFISAAEAALVAQKFHEIHPTLPVGFYADAYNPDEVIKQDIFSFTDKIFQKAIDEKFKEYKKLGSTFLCKAPGKEGKVNVHQDWTVVDEQKYYSATIWVPTIDTSEENGTLRVLPGSHLFFDSYRSNHIPVAYKGHEELIWENMISVPMKAGQAFVLNHAVIHGSSPNKTNNERLVIAYGVAPKEASLLFYHKEANASGDEIEKFEMPDDFFQRYYNVGERPLFGKAVDKFDYPVPVISNKEIDRIIQNERMLREATPLYRNNRSSVKKIIFDFIKWILRKGVNLFR